MQRADNYVSMPSVSLRAKIEMDYVFIKLIWRVYLMLKMCSSWRWPSMRRMIQNWEVGSQCPQYPQYPSYPQYPQWGGGSKIEKLVPNILNILKEDDDPKLEGWFPISSISSISSKRRMIPNWEVGSQYPSLIETQTLQSISGRQSLIIMNVMITDNFDD